MDKEAFIKHIAPKPYLVTQEYNFEKRFESFLEIASILCPDGFEMDDYNKSIFENGIKYFAGDADSSFPLNKGLLVYGPNGTGKSFFFKLMDCLIQGTWGKNNYKTITIDQIIDGVSSSGQKFFYNSGITFSNDKYTLFQTPRHMFIDDLCLSSDSVNYYGNNIDVIFSIIQRRYIAYTEENALTHITTNLKPELFREYYGDAVASRIKQMFHPVALMGKDRRK